MPIATKAPAGGTVEQFGGESHPLLLRNAEIERFEAHHGIGIFSFLRAVIGEGDPQARHCRDIVALALVGGGLNDKSADKLVDNLPPSENHRIRQIASSVLLAAFVPPEDKKKVTGKAGSSAKTGRKATTRATKSRTRSAPA